MLTAAKTLRALSAAVVDGFLWRDNHRLSIWQHRASPRPIFQTGQAMSDIQQEIDQMVKNNDIVLFMKGNASFPMCGFSGRAVQVLKACGVDTKTLKTVNVLENDGIRQGIKDYSNWPTVPQLYVRGEFIGGSDIMMEMYQSGELQQVIGGNAA
jgi:monothiol glutaredoxin